MRFLLCVPFVIFNRAIIPSLTTLKENVGKLNQITGTEQGFNINGGDPQSCLQTWGPWHAKLGRWFGFNFGDYLSIEEYL